MRQLGPALILLAAACSSADPIALAEMPRAIHGAVCQHEATCGVVLESDCADESLAWLARVRLAPDALAAPIATAIHATDPEIAAAVAAGVVHYDGGNARACADAIRAMACDVTSRSRRVTPPECFAIFTGTIDAGTACQRDEECASASCNRSACEDPSTCCTQSVCQDLEPSPVAQGGHCDFASCDAGLFCDASTKLCSPLLAAGAACDDSADQCAYGLGCTGGTCAALPAIGAACADACRDEGAACGGSEGRCAALGLKSTACDAATCSPYYPCDTSIATPVCTAIPHTGQTCSDQYCADGAYCALQLGADTGVCTAPADDGASCGNAFECAGGLCVNSGSAGLVCATPAACTSASS